MFKAFILLLVCLLTANAGITVINNVQGGATTVTIFDGGVASGINLNSGQRGTYNLPQLGLGIQENGFYYRSSNPNNCQNPDNAGMQLTFPSSNCAKPSFAPAVFCPVKNTYDVLNVASSGSWPNCVVTLTRKGSNPPSNPPPSNPPASGIRWNSGDPWWATGCDFPGNDIGNRRVPASQCGPACVQTKGCSHFAWSNYNGGTCWLKGGTVNRGNARSAAGDMVCGIRAYLAGATTANQVDETPTVTSTGDSGFSGSGSTVGTPGWAIGLLVIGTICLLLLVALVVVKLRS